MAPMAQDPYQNRLTSLYYETNYLCDVVATPSHELDAPELVDLQQRFRYQKDRLLTWGERWSGAQVDVALAQGSIDYSSAQAGCTEVVTAVLSHVKDLLNQAEEIQRSLGSVKRTAIPGAFPHEKAMLDGARWATLSKALYEDLVKDFTGSIDTLYDLLRARGGSTDDYQQTESEKAGFKTLIRADIAPMPNSNDTEPQGPHSDGSPTGQLPEMDYQSLFLVEERCYAYEGIELPAASGFVAKLSKSQVSSRERDSQKTFDTTVIVEYIPSTLLHHLRGSHFSRQGEHAEQVCGPHMSSALSMTYILRCLGFFVDPTKPRCGLVYELPTSMFTGSALDKMPWQDFRVRSLEQLLQMSSRNSGASTVEHRMSTPALEVRFRLAMELLSMVQEIHEGGCFLGNVNGSNIVFFQDHKTMTSLSSQQPPNSDLRHPFLCCFNVTGVSTPSEDLHVPDIYFHPDATQEATSLKSRTQQSCFDVYRLGLMLLEVGLWVPLRSLFKPEYSLAGFKRRLQGSYVMHKLPGICGSAYTRVVQDCLSVTDVSTDFYSSIRTNLAKCASLDEGFNVQASPALDRVGPESAATKTVSALPKGLTPNFRDFRRKIILVQRRWRRIYGQILVGRQRREQRQGVERHGPQSSGPYKCPAERCPFNKVGFVNEAERDQHYQDRHGFARSTYSCHYNDCPYKSKRENNVAMHMERCHAQSRHAESRHADQRNSTSNLSSSPSPPLSQTHQNIFAPLHLSPNQLNNWHCNLLPFVGRIVDRALGASKESLSIGLVNMGKSQAEANLTLLVECESQALIKSTLRRELDLSQIGCDLRVCRGKVRRSKAVKTRQMSPHRSNKDEISSPQNPQYQKKPLCGASIGAYTGEHLPAASFGGVVLVDEDPYGMTVHHMLEPPSDSEDGESDYDDGSESDNEQYDIANRSTATTRNQNNRDDVDDNSNHDVVGRGSSTHEWSFSSMEEDGDRPGVDENDGDLLRITQPALDDADEDLFPDPDDRDDDHLASHELGYIHASSGIRRWKLRNEVHEVDWALVKVNSSRLHPENVVTGGRRYWSSGDFQGLSRDEHLRSSEHGEQRARGTEDLYPTEVAKARTLGRRPVHCLGRTSGLQTGVVSPAMSYVRIHGRTTSSLSWSIIGDFGGGGDSGAWIIDNENGQVCGHVLARSSKTRITYMCPMQLMLEDMRRQLNAERVRLPGSSVPLERELLDDNLAVLCDEDTDLELPDISMLNLEAIRRSHDHSSQQGWKQMHDIRACGHNHPLAHVAHHRQVAQG